MEANFDSLFLSSPTVPTIKDPPAPLSNKLFPESNYSPLPLLPPWSKPLSSLLPVSLHPSVHDFLWSILNTLARTILLNPEQTTSYLFSKLFSGPRFLASKAQVLQWPEESSRYLCSCAGRSPSMCRTHSLTSMMLPLATVPASVISPIRTLLTPFPALFFSFALI